MSGLAAAAALSRHFRQVLVMERDTLAPDTLQRRGRAAGAACAWPACRRAAGLVAVAAGAARRAAGGRRCPGATQPGPALELPGFDPYPQRDLGWSTCSMTRPLLSGWCASACADCRACELRGDSRVAALLHGADGARRGAPDGQADRAHADLVIDASGRGALTLEALGAGPGAAAEVGHRRGHPLYLRGLHAAQDPARSWKTLATRPDPARIEPPRHHVPDRG